MNEPDPPYKRRRTEVFRRGLSSWSTVTACATRKKRAAGQPGNMEFYHVCEFQNFLRLWSFAMFVSSTCNRRDTGISSSRRCRPRCKSREMKSIDKTVEPAPKPDYPELISFLEVGNFLATSNQAVNWPRISPRLVSAPVVVSLNRTLNWSKASSNLFPASCLRQILQLSHLYLLVLYESTQLYFP